MNTIFWMTDELFAKSRATDWKTVADASEALISLIGNERFTHTIISPDTCIGPLGQSLAGKRFSAVIDLTDNGWLSQGLGSAIARETPVITDLHISRVREISDPRLPTSGHLVRTPREDIARIREQADLSNTLILDDVSFSGHSSELVMRLLGLTPRDTSHGFLITNVGNLGPDTNGAWNRLTKEGSTIHTGTVINTSEGDDGWHIKDFVRHDHLDRALGLIPIIHELLNDTHGNGDTLRRLFSMDCTRSLLFPHAVSGSVLSEADEAQFIRSPQFSGEGMHTTNPNLLTSPAFLEHISTSSFARHIDEISGLLHGLQELTNLPEGNRDAIEGMRRIVESSLHQSSPERRDI
jgi:hypothetical protein